MRETPVQKQASLHPTVVEEIGKTGEVPTITKRGPRGPYGPRKKTEPKVNHSVKMGSERIVFYTTEEPDTTLSQQEVEKLVDKRVIKQARKILRHEARVYTRIEIVDHETVIVR